MFLQFVMAFHAHLAKALQAVRDECQGIGRDGDLMCSSAPKMLSDLLIRCPYYVNSEYSDSGAFGKSCRNGEVDGERSRLPGHNLCGWKFAKYMNL